MKFNRFFAFAAAFGLMASFAACQKKDDPNKGNNEGPNEEKPVEVEKSKECDLLSLKLVAGDKEFQAFIYEEDRVAEVSCLIDDIDLLKEATAVAVVSDKATISPDPSKAADYTAEDEVAFTVTAEDGETAKTYYVEIALAKRVLSTGEPVWDLQYGAMDIQPSPFKNCSIAFCGKAHFATADLKVFNLDGTPAGILNMDGVVGEGITHLVCMSNTADGCLVASVGTKADGTMAVDGDSVYNSYYYAWVNGWDKAPVKIIEFSDEMEGGHANVTWYFTVQGDSKGECCIAMRSAVSANQAFNFYHYTEGIGNGLQWSQKFTGYASNDGNWGQWITMTTGNPDDALVICDSRGNNEGYRFVVRQGADASIDDDVDLLGTIPEDYPEAGPGTTGYGNFSIGHGRAFQLYGKDYVIACSSGWPSAYVTIQALDNTLPVEDQYILRTQVFSTSQPSPCAAYLFDEEAEKGIVLVNIQNYEVVRYDITSKIIPVSSDEESGSEDEENGEDSNDEDENGESESGEETEE